MTTLEPKEVCLTLREVCAYTGRTPQSISTYIRSKLLVKTGWATVTLHNFNKFLARKFPRLQRLDTVEALDAWRAKNSPQTKQ
jgi:hypothetical protein